MARLRELILAKEAQTVQKEIAFFLALGGPFERWRTVRS
jgi:hypothetical protein